MSNEKPSFFGYTLERQKAVVDGLDKFLKPQEIQHIFENLAYIEKLVGLSLAMKRQILSEFDLDYLAIAFKLSTTDLIKGFLNGLSSSMKQEVLFALQQEYKIGEVMDAQERLVRWLRSQEKVGSIVLCEVANSTLV